MVDLSLLGLDSSWISRVSSPPKRWSRLRTHLIFRVDSLIMHIYTPRRTAQAMSYEELFVIWCEILVSYPPKIMGYEPMREYGLLGVVRRQALGSSSYCAFKKRLA